MGFNPPPGKFPAKLESVSGGTDESGKIGAHIVFSASPKDVAYILAQVGESGTLEWTPGSTAPAIGHSDVPSGAGKPGSSAAVLPSEPA